VIAPGIESPVPDTTASTLALITRFENCFNARDVDALMADMSDDTVFEHVAPSNASIGRFVGQAAVHAVFSSLEEHFPRFDLRAVDIFAHDDRAACQWEMTWDLPDGTRAHARGADVFRVRDGKITEKRTYLTL
jgi:ketosteroid isomerase-like protein